MRTTVTLDQGIVNEVMEATSSKTKTKAVTLALKEYIRRKKIEKLRFLLGKVDFDEQAADRLRELEIKEGEDLDG